MNVSESGYYKYVKNLGRPDRDAVLSAAIMEILDESSFNDNYGVPRMKLALFNKGLKVGDRRLNRLLKELGLIHERKRRPKGLTKATTEIQEKENLIKQDFKADKPFSKLLTDISQVPCLDGKLYISPILDCFGGEVLALQMRDNMKKELCSDTLTAAASVSCKSFLEKVAGIFGECCISVLEKVAIPWSGRCHPMEADILC